ncbi:vWA domain-containing protein [Arthrobacter mangrovi]|uniref:VWFA domain-containing protein n=1 Tax=Arthrobacter mangrovi TaxID=2966350 RepID=A0ABQ5MTE2_9MICC|nr:VWA domain-containing protein [Arthrobacter mangrovi]GLB67256.1 hypothetical protein AHIS1636_16950 [Arthrobacter mangrovi]
MTARPPLQPRFLRAAAAALLATVALVPVPGLAPAAVAAEESAPGLAPAAVAAEESAPVMVVLDASGSMLNDDAPGLRIDAAKAAVKDLIDDVPDSARMGLMVYGTGTDSSPGAKKAGCSDIKTLAPVGPVDKDKLTAAVDDIKAAGYTPVGASLRAADKALAGEEGPRSIILVSDGIDTCAPPAACDVAKELSEGGAQLTVHSIGFKVDAAARAELECIADTTGGTYADAQDADALSEELIVRTTRAIGVYEAEGTPIMGGSSPADAPALPAGQYLDELEAGSKKNSSGESGSARYYKVELGPGERAHAAATLLLPRRGEAAAPGTAYVTAAFVDGEGESCLVSDTEYASSNQSFLMPPTAALSTPPMGEDSSDRCFGTDAGEVFLEVKRSGSWAWKQGLPVEVLLVTEPAGDGSGLPAAHEAPLPAAAPEFGGEAVPVAGAASYNTAAELESGVYSDSLLGGETKFYKVPVDYGQRLSFAAKVTADGGSEGSIGRSLRFALYSPVRQETELASDNDKFILGHSLVYTFIDVGDSLDASMAAPVRFNNRSSGDSGIEQIAYPGSYYLAASLEDGSTSDAGTELSFDLAVDVSGEPEDGPELVAGGAATAPSADPSAAPSAGPSAAAGAAEAASQVTGRTPLLWGLGAVGLLAVAGVVFAVVRRGSKHRKVD